MQGTAGMYIVPAGTTPAAASTIYIPGTYVCIHQGWIISSNYPPLDIRYQQVLVCNTMYTLYVYDRITISN